MKVIIDRLAEERKNAILNAPSQWEKRGAVYFVSTMGDDSANGTAPECAWKTLDKVNSAPLNADDVVLFERGGEWRGQIFAREGVTYSAYGEGEKPIINGSRQNYAIPEAWTETDVAHVYCFAETVENDIGVAVLNHGEAWSRKMVKGLPNFSGDLHEMTDDLDLYHDVITGKIYFRSDKGNPGTRFASIEMAEKRHLIMAKGDNVTVDNLFLRYGGAHGVSGLDKNGLTVRNCVIAWIGGSLQGVDPQAMTSSTTRYGNGVEIYVGCKDYTVENCWIYQIYDAGVTHQFKNANPTTVTIENVQYLNNLIERCQYSIEYFLDQFDAPEQVMKHILARGNICRLAGYGWGEQRKNKGNAAHVRSGTHPNPSEDFIFEENIFDRSRWRLIESYAADEKSVPLYRNNLFVQRDGGIFGRYGFGAKVPDVQYSGALANDEHFAGNAFAVEE